MSPRHLLPRPGTVLLFLAMALVWFPIITDRIEDWGTLGDEIGVPLLVLTFVGLCGVYGGMASDRMTGGVSQRRRLTLIFVRTALIGGLAAGSMALLA